MMKNLIKLALSIGMSFAILAILLKMVSTDLTDEERPSVLLALQNTDVLVNWVISAY